MTYCVATVDVVVTTRDQQPLTGLSVADFRVTENKQPRKLLTAPPLRPLPLEKDSHGRLPSLRRPATASSFATSAPDLPAALPFPPRRAPEPVADSLRPLYTFFNTPNDQFHRYQRERVTT